MNSMKPSEPLYLSSGQSLENPELQPLAEYLPLKTSSKRKLETQTDQLPIGSVSSTRKKNLARESASLLQPKEQSSNSLPVPKPIPKPRDRKSEALKRLGVDLLALRSAPEITPMLKNAEGGLKSVLGAMRFVADDPTIALFLEKYDATPTCDKEQVSWEAIALSAGLDLRVFLGSAMLALQSQAVNMVKIIAMTNHPNITKARVKYGLLPSGEKDRTALDTAMGFLPSPKGPTFIGKAIFGSGKQNISDQGAGKGDDDEDGPTIDEDDDPDLDILFPPSNDMQVKLINIRQKLLESNK